jgi:hypothetical protein
LGCSGIKYPALTIHANAPNVSGIRGADHVCNGVWDQFGDGSLEILNVGFGFIQVGPGLAELGPDLPGSPTGHQIPRAAF